MVQKRLNCTDCSQRAREKQLLLYEMGGKLHDFQWIVLKVSRAKSATQLHAAIAMYTGVIKVTRMSNDQLSWE